MAVDEDTGAVIAGAFAGWSCSSSNPVLTFDGSFDIERLPVGHSYEVYAEPLVGLASPSDFSDAFDGLCTLDSAPQCTVPSVDTNFNPRIRPNVP